MALTIARERAPYIIDMRNSQIRRFLLKVWLRIRIPGIAKLRVGIMVNRQR
ncbi:MAG: hypothetical protein ACLQIB_35175 [Isosphaeraceae bacterium]